MVALVRYDTMNNQLQSVLQDNLTSTGHIADCAIFKRKDVALRASSSGFMLTEEEMQDLENAFQDCSETRTNGINLKDVHYKIIRADKYSIYGKKVIIYARRGNEWNKLDEMVKTLYELAEKSPKVGSPFKLAHQR